MNPNYRHRHSFLCKIHIYYHHQNFYDVWPDNIKDINHLFSIGATFEYLTEPKLKEMLKTRCTGYLYDQVTP